MSWCQWSITVLWFTAVLSVVGQTSPINQCISSSFDWAINSLNQTPCLVAAYLESACGVPTIIPAVPVGNHYLGPNPTQADECRCSSVTYSAISACAACQGRSYIDWLTWSKDCKSVSLTTFPKPLPSAVVVPVWAYLNITQTNNNFSIADAVLIASKTSTTSSAVTTSTSIFNSLTSSSAALANPTLASSVASSTPASNSKSNAGAIAGGVVGGIGLVAIVGLGSLWFCLRRKRNMVQQNVAFDRRALVSGTGMSQPTGSVQGFLPSQHQRIYNNSYPGSLYTTPGTLESEPNTFPFGGGPQTDANGRLIARGYTGAAEI